MTEQLTKVAFKESIGTQFRVSLDPPTIVVLELTQLDESEPTPRQEQFSLLFRGPLETPFGQGMREVEHSKMGNFALFLVPIARQPDGMVYEAVFNRMINADGRN